MTTYLDLEGLIVARLEERITGLPAGRILTLPDLAGIEEKAQITPAIHVVYAGETVASPTRGAIEQFITQEWVVIVSVRHAEQILTGAAARAAAAPLLSAVNAALLGWTPGAEYDALVRTSGPRASYRRGFLYYPQAFACQFAIRGVR